MIGVVEWNGEGEGEEERGVPESSTEIGRFFTSFFFLYFFVEEFLR